MELQCYRVHKVGVTSETIQPDRGPTGMGMAILSSCQWRVGGGGEGGAGAWGPP